MITADRDPAGTGAKTRSRLRGKKSVPAETGEEGVTAAAANIGTAIALSDGMHFERDLKNLP
jgi:hypothetical protein